jgi:hypothetical protein
MNRLDVGLSASAWGADIGKAHDLVRVHVMLLRQLGQRLVASNGGQRRPGLEGR